MYNDFLLNEILIEKSKLIFKENKVITIKRMENY